MFRPLEVDVQGLLPDADALVVGWVESPDLICGELELATVRSLTLDASARWEAGEEARRLRLPQAESGEGLVIAYSERGGEVLQLGCVAVRYEDAERPELTLVLSTP
ncbi:MAG: hypothetical protein AAGD10_19590 [Myxococcota bacterium]